MVVCMAKPASTSNINSVKGNTKIDDELPVLNRTLFQSISVANSGSKIMNNQSEGDDLTYGVTQVNINVSKDDRINIDSADCNVMDNEQSIATKTASQSISVANFGSKTISNRFEGRGCTSGSTEVNFNAEQDRIYNNSEDCNNLE